ncbi:hypothetical protein [Bartonella pachyuromydis]|uniref:hypothetical protein n=1 Tax=Bartonella pachyuromydis TaxID=931097 RepID=UPI0031EB4AFA
MKKPNAPLLTLSVCPLSQFIDRSLKNYSRILSAAKQLNTIFLIFLRNNTA